VFTADPRIAPAARRVPLISSEEMLEMAANGSKILMARSVEDARRYGVPLHVRSSYSGRVGTIVADDPAREIPLDPGAPLPTAAVARRDAADPSKPPPPPDIAAPGREAPIISGVAHDRSEGKITVVEVPDVPGRAALLFDVVADTGANIDMIVQNS